MHLCRIRRHRRQEGQELPFVGSFSLEKEPEPEPSGHLKDLSLHAMSCYAYDEESRSTSDRAEVRSYMSCQDIAQCFNTETKKMVDYAWRPVTDGSFWVSWAVSRVRREGGSLMRMAMHWFLIEPKLSVVRILLTRVKDYPYRVSMILRKRHLVDC